MFSDIPPSRMKYPTGLVDRTKYVFWRVYTPFHPFLRDTCVKLGLVKHHGRQRYLLGTIAPGKSIGDVVNYLLSKGYGNHFVAWKDEGQVVSMRYVEDFYHQYHIRIFKDGEVRGHYEYTPESHPFSHLFAKDFHHRTEEFLKTLGPMIIPAPELAK